MDTPKTAPLEYQKRTGPNETRRAIAQLIGSEKLLEVFSEQLIPQRMPDEDFVLSLVWSVARDHYLTYKKLIDVETFTALIYDEIEDDPDLHDEDVEDIYDFLEYVVECRHKEIDEEWTLSTLKVYLKQIFIGDIKDTVQSGNRYIADLHSFLDEEKKRISEIDALGSNTSTRLFGPGWLSQPLLSMRSTTLTWLDHLTDGGEAEGDVIGIIAPFGTCKTTVSIQAVINKSKIAYANFAQNSSAEFEITVMVAYESPLGETRFRMLGYGAQVPRSRLKHVRLDSDLSYDVHTMKEYELNLPENRALVEANGGDQNAMRFERQRAETLERLCDHIVFINAVEVDPHDPRIVKNRKVGISEIKHAIEQRENELYAKYGKNLSIKVNGIYIDYVNAGIKNMMSVDAADWDKLRPHIAAFPLTCKTQLSMAYQTSTYLFQQFNGEAQKLHHTAPMHHSMAGECTTFGENLDFCVCIGSKSPESMVAIWDTKSRRGTTRGPLVLYVDGEWNRVIHRPEMVVDTSIREFVDSNEETLGASFE